MANISKIKTPNNITYDIQAKELSLNIIDSIIGHDNTPFLYRAVPSAAAGAAAELDEIVGGSVVWNQLVKETDTSCTVQSGHKYVLKQGSTYTVVVSDGTAFTVDGSVNDNVHDLTVVFGSTIADYIYSLEQSTAGSGIAWLKSYGYLTEDYYGYTANKIESVSVARHVMKDSNDSVIGSYVINPITLRGIPKLNASNQLYYDGDRYEASGRVTRKYGIVDLGTLTWEKINAIFRTNGPLQNAKTPSSVSVVPNICTSIHTPVAYENLTGTDKAVTIIMENSFYKGELWVHDETYNDAATFKTAMSGVYLVYELATPTTESTSPFEANQIVDANGTEEYIDAGVEAGTRDVAIPVGHETDYVASMTRGIGLPVQPNTDGVYSLQMNVTNSNAIFEFETASQALTYTLGTSGNNLTLTPSSGSVQSVTAPYATNAGKVNNHTVNKDVPSDAVFTDNDTKNTAGSTDTSSKIYLIGATSQAANPQTYSHDTVYVDTDGCLYSGGNKVLTSAPVTSVAGKTGAVTLTASDVGALASTTKYAGASTAGGSATSAAKLDTTTAGSATQPCYFSNGVPSACTYNLNKDVPSNAVFTDKNVEQIVSTGESSAFLRILTSPFQTDSSETMTSFVAASNFATISAQYNTIQLNGGQLLARHSNDSTEYLIFSSDDIYNSKTWDGNNTDLTDALNALIITGGATTITSSNLTASRALISDSNGKVAVSTVTSTELGYLDGVTSAVQTQLNDKLPLAGGTLTGDLTIEKATPNYYTKKTGLTIDKSSNNGLTSNTSSYLIHVDSTNSYFGRFRTTAYSDGRVASLVESRNMKTDENRVANYLSVGVNKDGTRYFAFPNDSAGDGRKAFREALNIKDTPTILEPDISSSQTVSTSNYKSLGSFTLTTGTWIVSYKAEFSANASGFRRIMLTTSSGSNSPTADSKITAHAALNSVIDIGWTTMIRVTGTSVTRYLTAYQNSGSDLTVTGYVKAIKVINV